MLAETLVATAREAPDTADRAARQGYAQVQAARREIIRLLRQTPFDRDDPAELRALIDELDAALGEPPADRCSRRSAGGGASAGGWAPAGWTRS